MYGILVLEDGTVLKGKGFGAEKEVLGELVFNTSMTGYVEILTDPSYKGQIITMTYPLEGNYGVKELWFESDGVKAEGFIIKDLTGNELDELLKKYNIPGLYNIDTRFITKRIRSKGVVRALLKTSSKPIDDSEIEKYIEKAKNHKDLSEIDLVSEVSIKEPVIHKAKNEIAKCVLIDCGVKKSIINCLLERNCTVISVPYNTSAEKILSYNPDFVLVSNGPGDPSSVKETISTVKSLIGKVPVTGICLGHQIITLALGGETYKMKFGHRGGNQPVKNLDNDKVYITSQNHGYATKRESMPKDAEIFNINLNDNTVEGLKIKDKNILCVQYHPEAGPGPHDARFLFDEMIKLGLEK
ncbi:glutamine-hydrolyzing carbamoyl-phosphate synthase small subunit [Methanothermococcus okinawensis]|uniref:Carbamoyl phosphate synthase small chain n=1 Tax=Methanothermococcus okinawensis (strain DSM 14208 / JCM 11175 / IH1) TaxID=647113 RepID=F8AKJ7_METOI|nr:glutamine-hydrolyzing carbamoyl-phosphate synthase small subunit [Methanothermococcus okinawensis]AEH07530.1 carbamoyl-phosphate synthase, small subunit [Methanothermococcus okinawensis IH1]